MRFKFGKRVAAVATCAAISFFGASSVGAAGVTYTVPEIDEMQITLPSDMSAITLSSEATDKYFSLFGIDYSTAMQNFENSNIYLQGMDSMSAVTVTVTMLETEESKELQNYNLLQADKLSEVSRNFLSQSEYTACTVDEAENPIVWLNFNTRVNSSGTVIEAYQANTVYDGKSVSVTLQRNGGNVTAADYRTFTAIVDSVKFNKASAENSLIPYIIAGAAVLAIVVILLIVILSARARKKSKKRMNSRILEELADKYNRKPAAGDDDGMGLIYMGGGVDPFVYGSGSSDRKKKEESYIEVQPASAKTEEAREYTDAEIDAILGEEPAALPEEAPSEKPDTSPKQEKEDVPAEKNSEISEYFEDEPQPVKLADAGKTEIAAETEAVDFSAPETYEPRSEESEAQAEDEDEEYFNDEVLVRDEVARTKFNDSDDFFEEAPRKTIGVISGQEIEDAEEYDVIGEVEKRVSEVEKETPTTGETVLNGLKKTGGAVKSFFVHCGYFITNLRREIKRSRARKKRQKAEEERRRRARERAARQREQRENGGLVQVHSRAESSQYRVQRAKDRR